ncbi:type II toxin-antitoxin system VapB family antitoxin [Arthrobacter sp. H5]|uniref:type II toxin-antitoxin system VapB family antitoxin n=1 Tax=Arthrobacter sp. H5 TaxID=1267973 RepID=UPI00047FFEAD|nr:type II toxin-antitoxin system VapB family antitoxin [Arthrobacter sp. H5]
MVITKVFRNNQSQAVRIPKALEWPESVSEVEVITDGSSRIISPVDMVWDSWFAADPVDESFPAREQPDDESRPNL